MTHDATNPIFTDILSRNDHDSRKGLISNIERIVGGSVIPYIENSNHPFAHIGIDDVPYFEDLLRSASGSKRGFLILNSSGGNADAAEKLLYMCRGRFVEGFTIIVPNFAKSAATMMCLGSDKIMMGYLAEPGPTDPQILTHSGMLPARSFIDSLDMIRENIRKGDPPGLYTPILQNIRPELVSLCATAIKNAECFAIGWLSKFMLNKDPGHAETVAKWLSDGQTYKSHGKVINYHEAKSVLRLNVEKLDPDSELWHYMWELYVRTLVYVRALGTDTVKIFESQDVSLTMRLKLPR